MVSHFYRLVQFPFRDELPTRDLPCMSHGRAVSLQSATDPVRERWKDTEDYLPAQHSKLGIWRPITSSTKKNQISYRPLRRNIPSAWSKTHVSIRASPLGFMAFGGFIGRRTLPINTFPYKPIFRWRYFHPCLRLRGSLLFAYYSGAYMRSYVWKRAGICF